MLTAAKRKHSVVVMANTRTGLHTIAIPLDLLEKIKAHARKMEKQVPGVKITATNALRFLVIRGLEVEASTGKR